MIFLRLKITVHSQDYRALPEFLGKLPKTDGLRNGNCGENLTSNIAIK